VAYPADSVSCLAALHTLLEYDNLLLQTAQSLNHLVSSSKVPDLGISDNLAESSSMAMAMPANTVSVKSPFTEGDVSLPNGTSSAISYPRLWIRDDVAP
jgi:hypothetical protein